MNVLLFINTYIKYVYIVLAIVLIVMLVKLFKQLGNVGLAINPILDSSENITNSLNDLKTKTEIVDHTMKTSVPFFTNIIVGIVLLRAILKDYHETKNSKRSLRKSVSKIYKYQKRIDPNFSVLKMGQSFMKTK